MAMRSSWSGVYDKISSSNKSERRKIAFVKAKKPFNGSQKSSSENGNGGKHKEDSSSHNTDLNNRVGRSSPKTEIFPSSVVKKYCNWLAMKRIGPGMINNSNTCYMNSVLQCLIHVPPLSQVLLNEQSALSGLRDKDGRNNATISLMYQRLVEQHFASSGKVICPRSMINSLRRVGKQFRPHRQEDAHEYLRQLLDCMDEESRKAHRIKANAGKVSHTSFISQIFGGYLCNELKCLKCGKTSRTSNYFQDISLEIGQGISSVDSSIASFTRIEKLCRGNEWSCDQCKKKVQATKQMTFEEAPVSLVLHLKRFSFGGMFDKIKKHIAFSQRLSIPLGNKKSKSVRYELTGVVVHHGYSVHSGHYIAFVKSSGGQWYKMDDCSVSMTNINNVLKQQAYILFYTQVPSPSESIDTKKEKLVTPSSVVSTQNAPDKGKSGHLSGECLSVEKNSIASSVQSKGASIEQCASTDDISSDFDSDKVIVERMPIELMTRLPARTSKGLFIFQGTIGKLHRFKRLRKKPDYDIMNSFEEWDENSDNEKSDSETEKADLNATNQESSLKNEEPKKVSRQQLLQMSMRGRDVGGEGVWTSDSLGDDDGKATRLQNYINEAQKKLRRKEQKERAMKRPSDWNQMLDSGRQKKVKSKKQEDDVFDGINAFQRVQDSFTSKPNGANQMDAFIRNGHIDTKRAKRQKLDDILSEIDDFN